MSDTIIQPGRPEGVPLGLSRKARVDAFQRVAANMNEANNLRLDATSVVFLARQLEQKLAGDRHSPRAAELAITGQAQLQFLASPRQADE